LPVSCKSSDVGYSLKIGNTETGRDRQTDRQTSSPGHLQHPTAVRLVDNAETVTEAGWRASSV